MTGDLTPWFDGTVKPVRRGWYERLVPAPFRYTVFSYWNGKCWMYGSNARGWFASDQQDLPWRGLANEPATNQPQGSIA